MKQKIVWLTGILGVQILLVLVFYVLGQNASPKLESKPLINFDKTALSKVSISDGDADVVLERKGNAWNISTLHNLPVNQAKLEGLLDTLASLQTQWPVTSTTSSHQRFEVATNAFNKRITLFEGEQTMAQLYFGTSPGFKKSHVRVDDADEVYALEINAYELATKASDWLDKSLLAVPKPLSIKGDNFEIKLDNTQKTWVFADAAQQTLDQEKAQALADALTSLNVIEVADNALTFDGGEVKTLTVALGEAFSYHFMQKDSRYYVKRADIGEAVFTISQHDYEGLVNASLESLQAAPEVASESPEPKE